MPHLPSFQWSADEYGELSPAWDADAHAEWREKWAPAWPDENPQRLLRALGFRERNVVDLELRVALAGNGKSVAVTIATEVEISVAGIVVLRNPAGEATQSDERQEGGTNV